jgi:hypothetical protein
MKKANSFEKSGMQPSSAAGFGGYANAARAFLKALGKQADRPVSELSPREVHATIARVTKSKRSRSTVTAKPKGDQAAVLLLATDLGARVGDQRCPAGSRSNTALR